MNELFHRFWSYASCEQELDMVENSWDNMRDHHPESESDQPFQSEGVCQEVGQDVHGLKGCICSQTERRMKKMKKRIWEWSNIGHPTSFNFSSSFLMSLFFLLLSFFSRISFLISLVIFSICFVVNSIIEVCIWKIVFLSSLGAAEKLSMNSLSLIFWLERDCLSDSSCFRK